MMSLAINSYVYCVAGCAISNSRSDLNWHCYLETYCNATLCICIKISFPFRFSLSTNKGGKGKLMYFTFHVLEK
ncbi:hypothetical protein Leryth_016972 [Lithospermum erythrorhizon]|nr:hypothetical protein Leryth_016972 [Lithospermum erythrorhizon]